MTGSLGAVPVVPRRISDLPFHERPWQALLHLEQPRDAPDHDYAGYGWARMPRVALADAEGAVDVVGDALVLALHTPDDAEASTDDLELEFVVDERSGASVTVLLSAFLACWLPAIRGDAPAVVLAVCNPHGAWLPRPDVAADVALYWPVGDVTSWLVDDEPRLLATRWHCHPRSRP